MLELAVNLVKVFSATRAADRTQLGEKVTVWLATHPTVTVLRTAVLLSSDSRYHCYSIVLIGHDPGTG